MAAPFQLFLDPGLEDLNPIMAGEYTQLPDRLAEPRLFNAVIIHHVRSGYGTVCCRSSNQRVGPGQAFILLPGETAECTPDADDPWEIGWVAFTGKLAYRFSALPPVFTLPEGSFPNLYDLNSAFGSVGFLLSGDLFTLYARLLDPQQQERDFVQLIVEHIEKNYMQKLTVENFARRFNMDRRYLSQQFKAKKGVSVRTYLTQVRMTKAKELLACGCSTSDTAAKCGFSNTSNFHKMFTSFHGMTPLQWKQQCMK